jgi:hypothetical protein
MIVDLYLVGAGKCGNQLGMGSGLGDPVWGVVVREWLFISVVLDLGRFGRTGE